MPATNTPSAAPAAQVDAAQLGAEILRSLASNPTRNDWVAYEAAKRQFEAQHPGATADQHEAFIRCLARRLNV